MRTVKNVLYLSYDGLTDPLGQSQVLPYLNGLAKKGYAITVVSFEKPERFKTRSQTVHQHCNEMNLHWKPLRYHKHPPVVSTLIDVFNLIRTIKRLHKEHSFTVVHCRSYITAIAGFWLKNRYGVKFIFDMRGFWADERVEGGLWNLRNPLYLFVYKFFKKKEKAFLRGCDHIISLTENAAKQIVEWGIDTPVSVIPCCVDISLFDPSKVTDEEKKQLRTKLGVQPDTFILLYLGSWGTWYLTDEILQFFLEMKKVYQQSKLLILSTDNIDLSNYSLVNDVIILSAERHQVPMYISVASAAIFLIKPSFSKKASSATKMGELLAMNVPVITNSGWGDVAHLVNQSIVTVMDEVKGDWRIIENRKLTRKYCIDHLSLEIGVERYSSVYEELLSRD